VRNEGKVVVTMSWRNGGKLSVIQYERLTLDKANPAVNLS
jgi:hypothetical protein